MPETPQAYADRITSYVRGADHLGILRSTPKTITALLRGKTVAFLKKQSASGKWSIAQILAHLADSEIVLAYRLRLVAAASGTPIQAFDQDLWQSNAGYLQHTPREALELFSVLRGTNVAFLTSLKPEQWNLFGLHAERGQESIIRMVEMYAGHDVNHLRQIREFIGTGKGTRKKRKSAKIRRRRR